MGTRRCKRGRLACVAACLSMGLALANQPALAETCESSAPPSDAVSAYSTGWGYDHRNTRFQPRSTLTAANAKQLELSWTYALGSVAPRSWPLITADTLYIGSDGEGIIALDRDTGCERWRFAHSGPIGSAIVPARIGARAVLIFNDRTGGTYAIDARDGAFIWHAEVHDEPVPWYSGTPLVMDDTVYVPVSSLEVGLAVNPLYGCCTTSGGMAAIDLATGAQRWYRPTIEAPAKPTRRHYLFVQQHGPSGAAVWATPSIDVEADRLYFGTGQNYSHPTTDTSDAIFAVRASTGEVLWVEQFTPNDAYNAACNAVSLDHPNCPKPLGPDVDFGAPTMLLRTAQGRELLIAGQKSSQVHALDPATGERVWSVRLGRGGIIGGVHWGMAANESAGLLFVPISDKSIDSYPSPGVAQPGMYALDIATGEQRWRYARESRCDTAACVFGLSAAASAANDVVVAPSIDGYLDVLDAATGKLLWSHDAWRDYPAVNDAIAIGGGFDAHGALLADDLLIVAAGYAYVGDQRSGNALLVFKIGEQKQVNRNR